jgi:hypothetical protein
VDVIEKTPVVFFVSLAVCVAVITTAIWQIVEWRYSNGPQPQVAALPQRLDTDPRRARRLSEDEKEELAALLEAGNNQCKAEIRIFAENDESVENAQDFRETFERAGWQVGWTPQWGFGMGPRYGLVIRDEPQHSTGIKFRAALKRRCSLDRAPARLTARSNGS